MKAEIISTGAEILLGHIIDTNTAYLSRILAVEGISVYRQTTIGDNPANLKRAIERAITDTDIVITIGGLGPTVDDVTLYALGSATSRALVYNKGIARLIREFFKKRRIKPLPPDAMKQAYIPRGARWFENEFGTASSVLVEHGKKLIVALPGPPRELIPIVEKRLLPYLRKKRFIGKRTIKSKMLRVAGLIEADVNRQLKDLLSMGPETTMGIYTKLGEVELRITSRAKSKALALKNILKVERIIRKRLRNHIFGSDSDTLESAIGTMLTKKKKTLAIAESCTGGRIANRITNIAGSSRYFKMGVIAYSNKSKTDLLGVLSQKIKRYGAVSKEVAYDMARGIKKFAASDYSIAVTGVAGPSGGTKKKPVGLVYIAVSSNKLTVVKECRFSGTRGDIKRLTATFSLDLLRAIIGNSK